MHEPEISVIIPVFNVEKYLSECLDSVLSQTFSDFEVICVDDGSTDNSAKILEKYKSKDKRVKVILQKNLGVVVARNNAVALAKGRFIYPLDGDDIIMPMCLERLYSVITTTENRVVASEACCFGELTAPFKQPKFTKYEMYGIHECCVISALFYKSDFERFGGYKLDFNGYGGDDMDYWLNYIDNDMPMFRVSEYLFLYRVKKREESVWKNFSDDEFILRQRYKNALLQKYHPKMKEYVKQWNVRKRNASLLSFFFQIRRKTNRIIIRLFRLPILKIKNRSGFYLFGFFPILKIKSKYEGTTYNLLWWIPLLKSKPCKKHIVYKLLGIIPVFFQKNKNIENYNRIIAKLRSKSRIRIGFLVWENSKWAYESLYRKFAENEKFEVVVIIVNINSEVSDLLKNIHFFGKYNYCIVQNIEDFKEQNIDIVFYEQPWFALDGDFTPSKVSEYALTFYVPYAVQIDADNIEIVKTCKPFYKDVYMSFVLNEQILENFKKCDIDNMMAVGHPKLDIYLNAAIEKYSPEKDKFRIIYAPHHSFGQSILKWATWEWNGEHILQLARKNQDNIEWIFTPHPRFKFELENLFGDQTKAQTVFDNWSAVATICDTGGYFDLFESADLMISDCGSFVLEWLPTGKPYIQLLSKYPNASPRSETDEYYSSQYYKCNNLSDIDKYFELLVKQQKDPLKENRMVLAHNVPLGATQKIYDFIESLIC